MLDREQLVNDNARLVHFLVQRYFPRASIEYDDLVQEGMIGLWKAARAFDPERGIKFSTMASTYILNQARMAIRSEDKRSRVPARMKVPIDAMVSDDVDSSFAEIIPDPTVDVQAEVMRSLEVRSATAAIHGLAPFDRRIMELYAFDELRQDEIARITGKSQSYVSRRMVHAQAHLRQIASTMDDRRISMSKPRIELNYDVDVGIPSSLRHRSSVYHDLVLAFDRSRKPCAKVDLLHGVSLGGARNGLNYAMRTHGIAHIKCSARGDVLYLIRCDDAEASQRKEADA